MKLSNDNFESRKSPKCFGSFTFGTIVPLKNSAGWPGLLVFSCDKQQNNEFFIVHQLLYSVWLSVTKMSTTSTYTHAHMLLHTNTDFSNFQNLDFENSSNFFISFILLFLSSLDQDFGEFESYDSYEEKYIELKFTFLERKRVRVLFFFLYKYKKLQVNRHGWHRSH